MVEQERARTATNLPIILTKLGPPRHSRRLIRRDELLKLVGHDALPTLVLISAPAGFGKTTTLTQWRDDLLASGACVAWLNLDDDDNDTTQCISYLFASLAEGLRDLPGWLNDFDASGQMLSDKAALTLLINGIHSYGKKLILILDDYDKISDPAIHEIVTFLLTHAPDNLCVAIATRSTPPLPLALLRAHNQLVEFDARSLRFQFEDTSAFLSDISDLKVTISEARALHDAMEGWAAGLQIAAIAMRTRDEHSALATSLTGSFHAVGEYLTQNVLSRLPRDVVDFMVRTSILQRMTAPLCEAVACVSDGQKRLEWLEAQNMFLLPLDAEKKWFRYHALFADYLRQQLALKSNAELIAAHERAAEWFAERGFWAEAVRHALAANRADQAVEWVERCAMRENEESNVRTLLSWVKRLPQSAAHHRFRLRAAVAWALACTVQIPETRDVIDDIEERLRSGEFEETDDVRWELTALRGTIACLADDTAAAVTLMGKCLERPLRHGDAEDAELWVHRVVRNLLTHSYEKAGNLHMARSVQADILLWPSDSNRGLFCTIYRMCFLAACDKRLGLLQESAETLREALRLSEQRGGRRSVVASLSAAWLAALHYEWDELDEVEMLLAGRLEIIDDACILEAVQSAYLPLARLSVLRGDFASAHAILGRAEILARKREWLRLIAMCSLERIKIWLLQNREQDAGGAITRLEDLLPDVPPAERCAHSEAYRALRLAQCRMHIYRGEFDSAVQGLREIIDDDEASQNEYGAAQVRVLLTVALDGRGEREAALACLARLFKLGVSAGLVRSIIDEGEGIAALVKSYVARHAPRATHNERDYFDRILSGLGVDRTYAAAPKNGTGGNAAIRAGEILSPRESDILALIARDQSNKQIARTLLLSPETVKWHVKNIFSKLEVTCRADAIARAELLGILAAPS